MKVVPFAVEAVFAALALFSIATFSFFWFSDREGNFKARTDHSAGGMFMRFWVVYLGALGIGAVTVMKGLATFSEKSTPIDCAAKVVAPATATKSLVDPAMFAGIDSVDSYEMPQFAGASV